MFDSEMMATLKVAADALGKEIGQRSTIVVIVHRPGKIWAANTSSEEGGDGLGEVSKTIASVAFQLMKIHNGETSPNWSMKIVGPAS